MLPHPVQALAEAEKISQADVPSLPLPMAAVRLSTAERRTMHDYVLGVAERCGTGVNESELFWDISEKGEFTDGAANPQNSGCSVD